MPWRGASDGLSKGSAADLSCEHVPIKITITSTHLLLYSLVLGLLMDLCARRALKPSRAASRGTTTMCMYSAGWAYNIPYPGGSFSSFHDVLYANRQTESAPFFFYLQDKTDHVQSFSHHLSQTHDARHETSLRTSVSVNRSSRTEVLEFIESTFLNQPRVFSHSKLCG